MVTFHFRGGRGGLRKMVITFHFLATLNFIYGPLGLHTPLSLKALYLLVSLKEENTSFKVES